MSIVVAAKVARESVKRFFIRCPRVGLVKTITSSSQVRKVRREWHGFFWTNVSFQFDSFSVMKFWMWNFAFSGKWRIIFLSAVKIRSWVRVKYWIWPR